MKPRLKSVITDNFSYKVVSLMIALILWFTILGRRDFQVTKLVEIDMAVAQGFAIESQSSEHVKVRVAGPRMALRKFLDASSTQVIGIDLSSLKEGVHRIQVPIQRLDLPFGVKVLSVRPADVEVKLKDIEKK